MKLRKVVPLAVLPILLQLRAPAAAAEDLEISVDVGSPTVALSPHLYGLFFEDINFAADGGLYAELIQNRSFEYYAVEGNDPLGREYHPLYAWEKVDLDGGSCQLEVVDRAPLNAKNTRYLEVRIDRPGANGVRNVGFDGIRLDAGDRYNVSLYARTADWAGERRLDVTLELPDGTVCGSVSLTGLGREWKKYEASLVSVRTSDVGRLVVSTPGKGRLDLDMISLFPRDTWKGRENGLRKDLVEALRELNPKFLRFPGGCIAHGQGWENRYNWKDTLGDVAGRRPNWNLWGYHQTYGLGYYEYFLLCKDLGMQPLPVVPVGVSCGFREPFDKVPMSELGPVVQDALDLIEFANGAAGSKWGAVRAEMGHPEPFGMEFICLGNEPHDTPEFRERMPVFVKAIRAKHPEIRIIGTSGLSPAIPIYDLMAELGVFSSDEHYYESPQWFLDNQNRFDGFDRNKPKIFIGEYASRGNTLFNAVAEAAYLTGVERNADIVDMTCYAPLFANVNHTQWDADLIFFDKRTVVRTPNYYVQQLFARNKGDLGLATTVTRKEVPIVLTGSVGIGTWRTTIEVEAAAVNGQPLELSTWKSNRGRFENAGGRYAQTDVEAEGAVSMSPEAFDGRKMTYTARVRKTDGREGFLVGFGGTDGDNTYWWNIGGWGNTRHALQRVDAGVASVIVQKPGSVEGNRWYDLKVEIEPGRVRCFMDGEPVFSERLSPPGISVSSTLEKDGGEVLLKLVNPTEEPKQAGIRLKGVAEVAPEGELTVLAGGAGDANSVLRPDLVRAETRPIEVAKEFDHIVPAMSVEVIRIKTK